MKREFDSILKRKGAGFQNVDPQNTGGEWGEVRGMEGGEDEGLDEFKEGGEESKEKNRKDLVMSSKELDGKKLIPNDFPLLEIAKRETSRRSWD